MAVNYGKWKPMKKTDPTYGSTSNVHNSAVYGTSLLCTCGFYVPPQKEKHLALDKFREHIVMVKGVAYAHDAVAKATQAFQTVTPVEPLSKQMTKPDKAKAKEALFGAIYGGGPVYGAGVNKAKISWDDLLEEDLEPLEGFVEVTEESLLDGDESYPQMGSFTQQKISFDPEQLHTLFPEWSATVPPPADWLLDYAIVHYNVPSHAKMLSVMKDPYAQAIVLTVQWKTKPTVPDQSVWDKAVTMAKDYGAFHTGPTKPKKAKISWDVWLDTSTGKTGPFDFTADIDPGSDW